MAWCGVGWCGAMWCRVVWCVMAWRVVWHVVGWLGQCGVALCGVLWCGVACCTVVWCGVVWFRVVWFVVVWCGVVLDVISLCSSRCLATLNPKWKVQIQGHATPVEPLNSTLNQETLLMQVLLQVETHYTSPKRKVCQWCRGGWEREGGADGGRG